jgi:predicted RND superfamily exporter protein
VTPVTELRTLFTRVLGRVLRGCASFSVLHPKTVLTACGVLTLLALWIASDLRLSTDIEDLLPDETPAARALHELRREYGGTEPVIVAVSGAGATDIEDRVDLALAIRERLAASDKLRVVAGMFGEDPWSLLEGPQSDALLLYLDSAEIEELAARLTPEAIDAAVAANYERLKSPLGPLAGRLIAEDPLGLTRVAFERIQSVKGRLELSTRDGVLVTSDEEYVLLLARIEGATHDYAIMRGLLDSISAMALEEMQRLGLEGTAGIGPRPEGAARDALHAGLTGAPAIIVDYREILGSDIRKISGVALAAVLILFLLAFRRLLGLLVAAVPLAVGVIWTLAFGAATIGEISVFTAGSVAILSGLAIDFTIHLYNRYLEEVHAGRDMATAFKAAHGETGFGLVAAALTTSWAFFAAGLSTFRGLRDLGMLCAAGIALSLVSSLLLVPALTALAARLHPTVDRPRGLASFGLGSLLGVVVARPRTVVAAGIVSMLLLAWPAANAHLDEDFQRFRPQHAPSIVLQSEIASRVGASLQTILALTPGADADSALELAARVENAWKPLVNADDGPLSAVMSPSTVIPPKSAQSAALQTLVRLRDEGLVRPASVERELLDALSRHGFRVDDRARAAAARVRRMLERDSELSVQEALEGPLAPLVEDTLLLSDGGPVRAVVSAYPRRGVRTKDLVQAVRARVEDDGIPAVLVGGRILSEEIKPLVLRDGVRAVVLSAAGVLCILLIAFRRPILVVLTFLPLAAGLVGSVGLMALLRIDFNLVSISMLPLILGIGIDNGIHIVHRFLVHSEEQLVDVFQHTGRGIVTTSLTTIVGFGALAFADYPGLISSGLLAILGVGATLMTAITLLPALLKLVHVRDLRKDE